MIQHTSISQNASTNSTESLGLTILKSRQFYTEANWLWIGTGAMLGFLFAFNLCYIVALTYLNRGYLYLFCMGTPKYWSLFLRFVQNVQHLRSLKLLYQKGLTMPKLEERLSYHPLEKPQLTKLHPRVMKLIPDESMPLYACFLVI